MSFCYRSIRWVYGDNNKGGLLTGPYPKEGSKLLDNLLGNGVDVFINLCNDDEIICKGDYTNYVMYNSITKNRAIIMDIDVRNKSQLLSCFNRIVDMISHMRTVYVHDSTCGFRSHYFCAKFLIEAVGMSKDEAASMVFKDNMKMYNTYKHKL